MELSENSEKAVMARNAIQFQKGLSLQAFLEHYGSEEQCEQALYRLRWPQGFVCPACGNNTGCALHSRKVYQCHKCHHQTSLTAGTIFHGTKLALTQWFLAIFLLTQRKQSVSALQLSRDLGVKYDTAWRMKHKLMQVMLERSSKGTLGDRVEIDDAYLGGEMPGKRGRGAHHKVPFIAAVETTQDGPAKETASASCGRFPAAGDRTLCQCQSGAGLDRVFRRSGLLRGCHDGRLSARADRDRQWSQGRAAPHVQMGEYTAWQRQDRANGDLPCDSGKACTALPCRVRIPFQPSF